MGHNESKRQSNGFILGIKQTDYELVWVSLRLANRPNLAGKWKFNTSLLEIRDFWKRLETLIQRALGDAVTGNN